MNNNECSYLKLKLTVALFLSQANVIFIENIIKEHIWECIIATVHSTVTTHRMHDAMSSLTLCKVPL